MKLEANMFLRASLLLVFIVSGPCCAIAQQTGGLPNQMPPTFAELRPGFVARVIHTIDRTSEIQLAELPNRSRRTVDRLRTTYQLQEVTENTFSFVVTIGEAIRQTLNPNGALKSSQKLPGLSGLQIRIKVQKDGTKAQITNEGPVFMRLAESDPKANELIVGVYSEETLLATMAKPFWLASLPNPREPKDSPANADASADAGEEGSSASEGDQREANADGASDSVSATKLPQPDDRVDNATGERMVFADVISLGLPGELRFEVDLQENDQAKRILLNGVGKVMVREDSPDQRMKITDVQVPDIKYVGHAILAEPKSNPSTTLPGTRILSIPQGQQSWFQFMEVEVNYSGRAFVETSAGKTAYKFRQVRKHTIESVQSRSRLTPSSTFR